MGSAGALIVAGAIAAHPGETVEKPIAPRALVARLIFGNRERFVARVVPGHVLPGLVAFINVGVGIDHPHGGVQRHRDSPFRWFPEGYTRTFRVATPPCG